MASVAFDHPPTRRAVRRIWWWAVAKAPIGLAGVAAVVLFLINDLWIAALVLSPVLAGFIVFGLEYFALAVRVGRALRRHRWQRVTGWFRHAVVAAGYYAPVPSPPPELNGLRIVDDSGSEALFGVGTLSYKGFRALDGLSGGEVWLAIGDQERWGVGAVAEGSLLFVVTRARPGSKGERKLKRLMENPRG